MAEIAGAEMSEVLGGLSPIFESIRDLLLEEVVRFGLRQAGRALNEGDPPLLEPELHLFIGDGDEAVSLTTQIVDEIRTFLALPSTVALLRLRFIQSLARSSKTLARAKIDEQRLEQAFRTAAEHWCSNKGQTWSGVAPLIWKSFDNDQVGDAALPPFAADELVAHYFFGAAGGGAVGKHIEVLTRLSSDAQLREDLGNIARRARALAADVFRDTFLVQGDADEASFADLYVDRTLISSRAGLEVTPEIAFSSARAPVRLVVIGEPGVGKSTMVRWLLRQVAERAETAGGTGRIPLLVMCRELLTDPTSSVQGAIQQQFLKTYGEELTSRMLEGLLAVGELTIVLDGLDEVQDPAQRSGIVQQLTTLARHYPLAPIIAVTRRTGPEVQQLQSTVFRVYSLAQYDERQVREYCERWFKSRGTPDRAGSLIGQSWNLEDIRCNPLMLSLLCILFSRQEHIPQSRRGLYERCAALMFHEWDPKRGIQVPNIFKDRGTAMLQEVARSIDRAGGYGHTVPAEQLRSVVQLHLEKFGIDSVEASASAQDLINYCSRRAWVLSARTVNGALEFGFTHRTFYEFYLAEAKIKSINQAAQLGSTPPTPDSLPMMRLTREIWESWKDDPTSVLPELLIQAADFSTEGVSPNILREIVSLSRHQLKHRGSELIGLSVRLLAATGADRSVATLVLENVIDLWNSVHDSPVYVNRADMPESRESRFSEDWARHVDRTFLAMLEMPSANRRLFFELVSNDGVAVAEFQRRYARIVAADETGLFHLEWKAFSDDLPPVPVAESDALVALMEMRSGKRSAGWTLRHTHGIDAFHIGAQGGSVGAFWTWLLGSAGVALADRRKIEKRLVKEVCAEFDGRAVPVVPRAAVEPILAAYGGSVDVISPDLAIVLALVARDGSEGELSRLCGLPLGRLYEELAPLLAHARNAKESDLESIGAQMRDVFRRAGWKRVPSGVRALAML